MIKKISTIVLILLTSTTLAFAGQSTDLEMNTSLTAIKTSVETLDNAISGAGYNITQVAGATLVTGNGVTGTGSPRVTIASDNTANTNPWLVDNRTTTSGGSSVYSASVTSVASAKASAGRVYSIDIFNTTAAVAYLQVFDVASGSITLGTTAPTYAIGIAASGKATVAFPGGIDHATAVSVAGTTTRTGSTTAALDIVVSYE